MLKAESGKVKVFYEDDVNDWFEHTTQKALAAELKNYPNEKVLFFPENRVLTVETDIIHDIMESERLMGAMSSAENFLTKAERRFDLSDPYVFRGKKKGDRLTSGYMQIMNFLYTIRFNSEKELIVGIEFPEVSLHYSLQPALIETLSSMQKIEKLVIATRAEELYRITEGTYY